MYKQRQQKYEEFIETESVLKNKDKWKDHYWTDIIEPIRQAAWWQVKRPSADIDGKIWDTRMAMLDALSRDTQKVLAQIFADSNQT